MLEQVAEKLQRPQLPDKEDAERFVRKYISYCTRGNNEFFIYGHDGTQLSFAPGKPVRSLVGAANWVYEKVRPSALLCSALRRAALRCPAWLRSVHACSTPPGALRAARCTLTLQHPCLGFRWPPMSQYLRRRRRATRPPTSR